MSITFSLSTRKIAGSQPFTPALEYYICEGAESDQQKPQEITKLFRYGIYVLACFEQSL